MYVERPPDLAPIVQSFSPNDFALFTFAPVDDRRYFHWDELRRRAPPEGHSHRTWWLALKLGRQRAARRVPLLTTEGHQASFSLPDDALRLLHFADQHCAGEIASEDPLVTSGPAAQRRYLLNSLMEEAIRSSQLEGATTSRIAAKDLLRTGREPADRSERMILNHYRGLEFSRDGLGDTLTPEGVLELHRILTEGTFDDPSESGRLQRPDDDRVTVHDRLTGKLVHRPPPASELPERLEALCDFANARNDDDRFIHPVVRAIIVHFWLGHDHPFADGNGRTARSLFYWSMRTQGYWLVEYLPLSRILLEAPSQYSRAYVHAETDGGDLTYFILHQLRVLERAVNELHTYLSDRVEDTRRVEHALHADGDLNHRQIALLGHALRHVDPSYTFAGHAGLHRVTHETARTDIAALERRGLLVRHRKGRGFEFLPAPDLRERLHAE